MGKSGIFNLQLFVFLSLILLGFFIYLNQPKKILATNISQKELSETESVKILEAVKHSNDKFVINILSQEQNYRLSVQQNIENLQKAIAKFCSDNQYFCRNFDTKRLLKQMLKDKDILLKLSSFGLQNQDKNKENDVLYKNKTPEYIDYAREIIKNKASLQAILAGKMPEDININWEIPTILGGIAKKDIKGTNKMLGFITSLFYLAQNFKINIDNYQAISYSIQTPEIIIRDKLYKIISEYTFFKNNMITLFHNGQENGINFNNNKLYPKDSSVWIGEILGIEEKITTLHLMSYFDEVKNSGFVLWDKDSIKINSKLKQKLRIIDNSNIKNIIPGIIVAERFFDSPDDIGYKEGIGGRIGVIIGVDYDKGDIFALSYIGDIEQNKNGFGMDIYKYNDEKVLQMFFKIDNDQ